MQAQALNSTTFFIKHNKLPISLIKKKGNINSFKQHTVKITVLL